MATAAAVGAVFAARRAQARTARQHAELNRWRYAQRMLEQIDPHVNALDL